MSLLSPSPRRMPERIAAALGGRPSGNGYSCRCPCHDDRHASLSLWIGDDGRLCVWCHAGCPRDKIIAHLDRRALWPGENRLAGAVLVSHRDDVGRYRADQRRLAADLWRDSVPLERTPAETYLRTWRGRTLDLAALPRVRWHWKRHALVALATHPVTDTWRGVQLTCLDKLTDRKVGRLTIGQAGIVRLLNGGPGAPLLVGEGAETVLSAAMLWAAAGHNGSAWATLGAGALARLRPPPGPDLVLLVDRDSSGAGERAARRAAARLSALGRRVRLAFPPDGYGDFNDVHRRAGHAQ